MFARVMRLHLIDGTYELFRAHFSKRPPQHAPNGNDVKATVGLISSLLALLALVTLILKAALEWWQRDEIHAASTRQRPTPQKAAP